MATRKTTVSRQASRPTYAVRAQRWARGWELHIDGVGTTQARSLTDAEPMAHSYIMHMTGTTEAFNVDITLDLGEEVVAEVAEVAKAVAAAKVARRAAALTSRRVVRYLDSLGLNGRDIAQVLTISPQRVSQLLNDDSLED